MTFAFLSLLLSFVPIVTDISTHCVTITATATGVDADTMLEFLLVGPDSDRAYESMFVTDANVSDIAKAFDAAGIPTGKPIGALECRFWPVGPFVRINPDITEFVKEISTAAPLPIVYTGGTRDAMGIPVANTNMPSSVLSFYSLGQSLLLLDDALEQSMVYGRFVAARKIEKGKRFSFRISWDGNTATVSRKVTFLPGKIKEALSSLKSATHDIDVLPDFSPELTVGEAKAAADALATLDSRIIKVGGFVPGQLFYRSFQPNQDWNDRQKRLTQPVEIRISSTNLICTLIEEDWSGDGMDPILKPHVESIADARKLFKGDTCFLYVSRSEKLSRLYSIMKMLPNKVRNWYVFVD